MSRFIDVWSLVVAHAPSVEPMLARTWVQWAYAQFCDRRGWSHLKAEGAFSTDIQRAGLCTCTRGSATVLPGTLVFVSTDVGRQLKGASIPLYTIIAYDGGSGAVTLDRTFAEPTTSTTNMTILDAYMTVPEDFQRFIAVLDPNNKWKLRYWVTGDAINQRDPGRTGSGNARILASLNYSPVPGSTGRARYELYPYQTGARTYWMWYYRKPELLADSQEIIGPLARRASEILLEGALSRCAMWPGTEGRKNLYFNLQLAETHRKLFEEKLIEVAVQDDDLYFESLPLTEFPFADFPWDSAWLQQNEPYMIG